MRLRGWLGKLSEFGTRAALFQSPEDKPKREYIRVIEKKYQEQFEATHARLMGCYRILDQTAAQIGEIELERESIWKDIRKHYKLQEGKENEHLQYSKETGAIYRVIK